MSAQAESLVPGARHAVPPAGITATAWPRVRTTCNNIGWRFDPWQDAVGRLILARAAGGKWAADLSILSIPRQVGKSYLLGCIIFALCLLNPRLRVIWTSHHTATTEEMYESMKELAQHKRVAPHVAKCIALQGSRWRIIFRNGARIDFGARERGFGRGKAKVGVLVLDEFQHISMRALSNLTPTTNTAENPLILCAGTPPSPHDNGEAFAMRRKAAVDGLSSDTFYVEFSADPDADLDDRKQWAKANPSFPKRTPERAFLLNRKILDDESFRREFLGIHDESASARSPFPNWPRCISANAPADGTDPTALGVDMSHERVIAITGAWVDPALPDDTHLELLSVDVDGDTAAAVEWIVACAGRRIPVLIAGDSPAASMAPALKARKVKVFVLGLADQGKACGGLHDAIRDGHAWHVEATGDNGQQALDDAMAGCTKRNIGTAGAWGLDRSDPDLNIAPAVSAVLAHFGGAMSKRKRSKTRGVVFS